MKSKLQQTANDFFSITPSNTEVVKDDPNNERPKVEVVFLKNNTDRALSLKVKTVAGTEGVINIAPYYTEPLEVIQVFETGSDTIAAGELLAYYSTYAGQF